MKLIILRLIPESPRWLITMGKYDEARKVIEGAAKMNRLYTDDTSSLIDKCFENVEKVRAALITVTTKKLNQLQSF